MIKNINLKNDFIFKELFTKKDNQEMIKEMISEMLKEKVEKIEVEKDASLKRRSLHEKLGIIDIRIKLNNETVVDLEMQVVNNKDVRERALYYASKIISSRLKAGQNYKELKNTIVIFILDYIEFPEKEGYRTESAIVDIKNREKEITNKLKFYFFELPKLRKKEVDLNNKEIQWLTFIDGENKERVEYVMKKNKLIKKAKEELEYLTGDEEKRRIAELREKGLREISSARACGYDDGLVDGRNDGEKRGVEKGKNEEKKEIAKLMIEKNTDIKFISEVTKLSIEEIKKLKKIV